MKRDVAEEGSQDRAKRQRMNEDHENSTADQTTSQVGSERSDDATPLPGPIDHPTPPTVFTATSRASKKRNYPSEQKTIKCTHPECPKIFNRPARLLAHLRSHSNERPFKCTYEGCDKSYTEAKHLKQHIISHTKEAKYVCDKCCKTFATGTRLRRHQKVHEGEERFRCRDYPPCTQSFRKHQTLHRHILKEHLGEKSFLCPDQGCDASFDSAKLLRGHQKREHGEIRFWCDECCEEAARKPDEETKRPVGFTTQALLDAHIRQDHVNCIFCDVKFGGQYLLDQHMEIYHSGLTVEDRKTVECNYIGCGKKFTKKSNMITHYRTAHEGLRFVCGKVDTFDMPGLAHWNWAEEGCGHGFVDKAKLGQHVLFVHLGRPRPEAAPGARSHSTKRPTAGPSFLNEISGVTDHERRSLACTVVGCHNRFIRYADLQTHLRAQHPECVGDISLPGVSETPQLIDEEKVGWALLTDPYSARFAGPEQQTATWTQDEASLMQFVDLDSFLDPSLFT